MSLMDWIEADAEANDEDLGMHGSFGVAIGDVVNGIFGARHTHIFGGEIKLVCDPEDFLMGKVAHRIPVKSALAVGIGGQATFVYAQNTSATYGGPKVDIRRALNISKQSDYIIPRVGAPKEIHDPEDPIDEGTCAAVTVLSVLVILVPAVLELVIRFKYPSYGSTNSSPETKDAIEGYGETPNALKLCAYAVTSRLMELLKQLEESSTFADCARLWIATSSSYLKDALTWLQEHIASLGEAIDKVIERAGKAATAASEAADKAFTAAAKKIVFPYT